VSEGQEKAVILALAYASGSFKWRMNYFITFRTYGTWLHGDARGSVDSAHNVFGEEFAAPVEAREQKRREMMNDEPFTLNEEQRANVEKTVGEVCAYRKWGLHAVEVRSNHVHVLVSVPDTTSKEKVAGDLKAYATRRLRGAKLVEPQREVWAEGASKRVVFGLMSGERITQYIAEFQDQRPEWEEPEA